MVKVSYLYDISPGGGGGGVLDISLDGEVTKIADFPTLFKTEFRF